MNSQPPESPGMIQITITPRQLDVVMCMIEGTFEGSERSRDSLVAMIEKGAQQWHPDYDYGGFGVDAVVIAPVYCQMLDAWTRVESSVGGRNKGNEFDSIFEFIEAVKVARVAAVGGKEGRHV